MNKKNALIIFQKNLQKGKVKTRLAATIGDENAFRVFVHLVNRTYSVVEKIDFQQFIYYSDYIETEYPQNFTACVQTGADLGERMYNAFQEVFQLGYQNICIIGTDCRDLSEKILNDAFLQLEAHDVVIGPAADGGYYLLGMKQLYPDFFQNKIWSTPNVFEDTINDFKRLGLSFAQTAQLHDVDTAEDLGDLWELVL